MCGIAGIIDDQGINAGQLWAMSKSIKHRGPDDEGFLVSDFQTERFFRGEDTIQALHQLQHISEISENHLFKLGFVHRRLSILDLSPAGHQPMANHGKYFIVYNGEVYNYKELREELSGYGYSFQSDSDTEVILAAYETWGKACVQKFVGMWAFVIYDKNKQELFFCRDRFGIKPLYYVIENRKMAFASEIKALLQLDFVKPQANMEAVMEYIAFGATSDPSANLFKQIQVLPPAHILTVNLSSWSREVKSYYHLKEAVERCSVSDHPNIMEHYRFLLNRSVDLHLRSDVPVGSTLSGGLDSSTIVALAAPKMKDQTFHTFTAAYHEKEIDESGFAGKVTNPLKNIEAHFAYPDISNYWQDLEKLIWHQDLPINSTSMFAQWEVMKLAQKTGIKVLLDGQGADEMLGGYYNFAGIYLIELLKKGKFSAFASEKKALQEKFSPNMKMVLGRAGFYFMPPFVQRKLRAKHRLGMSFIAKEYNAGLENIKVPERGGKSFREQSILSMQYGLQDLLRYEDRNSMAFSIESRVPFLDHRLVEYSIALDHDWKIKNGWTKYVLRKTAEPILDKEVVWRKYKMGFLTPQKSWKESSQKQVNEFIEQVKWPSFLDKSYVLKVCMADTTDSSHLSEFWKMVSFIKWAELFKVEFE